jgi:hypothetical protein
MRLRLRRAATSSGRLGALLLVLLATSAGAGDPTEARALDLLRRWRDAWQGRALDDYLALYAPDARVGSRALPAHAEHERRLFAREGSVEVRVGDVSTAWVVRDLGSGEERLLRVGFLQEYRSPWLSDFGRKQMLLRPAEGPPGFSIVRESWEVADGSIAVTLEQELAAAVAPTPP